MSPPITSVTIVGGGTAGWLAAAYLNHRLQWGLTARHGVRITVIESPDHPTIGVGEATVPTLKGTLRLLEISEAEFFARTNASVKLGIRFDGWQAAENGDAHSFVHPFTGGAYVRGRNPGYSFQRYGLPTEPGASGSDFVRTVSHAREAIEQLKGARAENALPFEGPLQYAYHIDAVLFAGFLKEVCLARGVEYVSDTVKDVTLDERGHIASLELDARGAWPVELVIDCTGFSGRLINKALGEPFISYAGFLPNDRAIAMQVRRPDPRAMVPATISTALESGWCWRISLHSRDGLGYVYSSAFASDDEALQQLRSCAGVHDPLTEPRVIKMRVGRCQRSWVHNCVAIGLSSGFLEPLESTAILSVELACRWLLQFFPSTAFEEPLRRQFNGAIERLYDEVRDFLGLHFTLNDRIDTPYWQAAREDAQISDTLRNNLAVWRHALPSIADARSDTIFSPWSVQCVLFGKGFYRDRELAGVEVVPEAVWRAFWADRRASARSTLARLPSHYDLLESIRASAVAGDTRARLPKAWKAPIGDEEDETTATQIMSCAPPTRLLTPRAGRLLATADVR